MLNQDGIPTEEDLQQVFPPESRLVKGPVAIAECFQKIPCNPCSRACPQQAIRVFPDLNGTPIIDFDRCIGCGLCVIQCPGLAIFLVDMTDQKETALVQMPYEFLPLPRPGQNVLCLDRKGAECGYHPVRKVTGGKKNQTYLVSVEVPKELAMKIRNIRVGGGSHA